MAEMSVNKGTGVAQIQGPNKHSNGHARRAPVRSPKGRGAQEEQEEREFPDLLVEIGEEARGNPGQEDGSEEEAQAAPGDEEPQTEGVKKIDVVI